MKRYWSRINSAFSPTECAEILSWGLQHKPTEGTVVTGKSDIKVEASRRCKVRWLDASKPELTDVVARLRNYMLRANAQFFGVECSDFWNLQLTEYLAGEAGYHQWHEDSGWIEYENSMVWDRKLTAVLMLSDKKSYEGGLLKLDREAMKEDFNCGDLVIFPSILKHCVEPVTQGVRHTLVAWQYGPRWR